MSPCKKVSIVITLRKEYESVAIKPERRDEGHYFFVSKLQALVLELESILCERFYTTTPPEVIEEVIEEDDVIDVVQTIETFRRAKSSFEDDVRVSMQKKASLMKEYEQVMLNRMGAINKHLKKPLTRDDTVSGLICSIEIFRMIIDRAELASMGIVSEGDTVTNAREALTTASYNNDE